MHARVAAPAFMQKLGVYKEFCVQPVLRKFERALLSKGHAQTPDQNWNGILDMFLLCVNRQGTRCAELC